MSDPFEGIDPLAETREGIQYVDETGKPEEPPARQGPKQRPGPNDEEPLLRSAADLLPPEDDPLASLPSEPPDADTPPDDATPAFVIVPNAYGPKVDSVKLASGQPVGVWLHEEHPSLDGGQVAEMLVMMGMDGERAAWFGLQRDRAREARGQLAADPLVAAFAQAEAARVTDKKQIQEAFVKAHKERGTK